MRRLILLMGVAFYFYSGFFLVVVDARSSDVQSFRYRANGVIDASLSSIDSAVDSAIDIKAEVLFGRELSSRILAKYPLLDDPKLQQYVNLLGQGIVAMVGRADIDYHFAVIDAAHRNAYAAPGGYIFVTKGLIDVCENEAQLVGVLAHEISHVNRKYIVEKFNIRGRESSIVNDIGIVISHSTQTSRLALSMIMDQVMDLFLSTGLGQNEELRSDQDAAAFMSVLQYDPMCYAVLIDSLSAHDGELDRELDRKSVSHTHPSSYERRNVIKNGFIKTTVVGDSCHKGRFDRYVQR